jgi:hypothetical protein
LGFLKLKRITKFPTISAFKQVQNYPKRPTTYLAKPIFQKSNLKTLFFQSLQNCDRYLQIEDQLQCGAEGYPLRIGYPFCSQLHLNDQRFSHGSSGLIRKLEQCQQKNLNALVRLNPINCAELAAAMQSNLSFCFYRWGVHRSVDLRDVQLYAELGRTREWSKENLDRFLEQSFREFEEMKFEVGVWLIVWG